MSFIGFFQGKSTSSVRRLLAWKQGDEDEKWAEKAVDALVKKLKNRKGAMEILETALNHRDEKTKCVTIPRSQDGRLQVSHRKGLPHVIYCRVWRWPDLQSHHELKSLPCCMYPFENSQNKEVCINPYHYERVINNHAMPPVMVARQSEFRPEFANSPSLSAMFEESTMPANFNYDDQDPDFLTNRNIFSPTGNPGSVYGIQPPSPPYSPRSFSNTPRHIMDDPLQDVNMADLSIKNDEQTRAVPFEETENWCSIQYFELNCKVGEPFHGSNQGGHEIYIDGFTDPTVNGKRFSLGQLSNIQRNQPIESARKHIGQGVLLSHVHGDVYAECLSLSPIFVQSRESNQRNGLHPCSIVKLTTGRSQKIFSMPTFAHFLRQNANSPHAYENVYELQKFCVIRMSFVKGWGHEYSRSDVSSTPCWIEIRLHAPLKWLDRVLTQIPPPPSSVTSHS